MNFLTCKSFSWVAAGILGAATVFSSTGLYAQEAAGGASPPAGVKKTMPRATLKEATSASDMSLNIVLDPITAGEKAELGSSAKGQPLKIGIGRDVPAPYDVDVSPSLVWNRTADGGLTASFSVHSPDAEAIRISLLLKTPLDEGIEFRFFGFGPREQVFGPVTPVKMGQPAARDEVVDPDSKANTAALQKPETEENLLYWSPVVEGDTIGVEIYLPPSVDPASFSLAVPGISHLGASLLKADTKSLSNIGASGSCHIDIACRSTFPSNLGNATAKVIYTDGGNSFLCTGTLMNDRETGTSIPYFLTANHCLSKQTVANTVNTFWFFEKASCGGANPTTVTQFTGGVELLATGAYTDYTFLELYDRAVSSLDNIAFSGWDPNALPSNTTVVGIHHPRGDLKKWSQGVHTGFANFGEAVNGTGAYMRILWSEGMTEQGSSGSGLFYYNAALNQDVLVGTLSGGKASCSTPGDPDWYGRFDLTYPNIRRWLNERASALTPGVTVSSSVAAGQWKEYKIVSAASTAEITVELTNLSSDVDLYVRKASRPNLNPTGYDCRPFLVGTFPETCQLNNSGSHTYFIGVYGATAGSFRLTAKQNSGGTLDTIGLFDPVNAKFYLRNSNDGGTADIAYRYGPTGSGWLPIMGDWNNDGVDTAGLYNRREGIFYLKNSHRSGGANKIFRFGPANGGWEPVAGDWNGDGTDTVGLYNPFTGTFFLRDNNSGGVANHRFRFGPVDPNLIPLAGDWNGNNQDTVGLYHPLTGSFYLKNSHGGGKADISFRYGPAGGDWEPVVGDWNGNGKDTIGLYQYNNSQFYLRITNTSGMANYRFRYGPLNRSWWPLTGKWKSP